MFTQSEDLSNHLHWLPGNSNSRNVKFDFFMKGSKNPPPEHNHNWNLTSQNFEELFLVIKFENVKKYFKLLGILWRADDSVQTSKLSPSEFS